MCELQVTTWYSYRAPGFPGLICMNLTITPHSMFLVFNFRHTTTVHFQLLIAYLPFYTLSFFQRFYSDIIVQALHRRYCFSSTTRFPVLHSSLCNFNNIKSLKPIILPDYAKAAYTLH